ncbi:hypothetical protein [Rhizobium leguminosarum]|uniref:hypothetical protein n=1 Tax=Rhizobium leguminosarum TaxID=384 RepID=UPI002FEECB4D
MRPYAATQIGAKTISYDANGNMVSDGTRTLTWDGSNRLSTVTQNGATVTLAYGPDRARVQKSWAFGTTVNCAPSFVSSNLIKARLLQKLSYRPKTRF